MQAHTPRPAEEGRHALAWLSRTTDDVPAGDAWLSAAEREVQARLVILKRRDDWRLGRYTAKLALASWLAADRPAAASTLGSAEDGAALPPQHALRCAGAGAGELAALAVLAAPDGAPEAWRDGRRVPVALSISHSHGRSLVTLAGPDLDVGCDIERVEPRSRAWVEDYLTPGEQIFLRARPDTEQALWATCIWSAKESALKALRQGLRLPTRAVNVRTPDAAPDGRAAGRAWRRVGVDVLVGSGPPATLAAAWCRDALDVWTCAWRAASAGAAR